MNPRNLYDTFIGYTEPAKNLKPILCPQCRLDSRSWGNCETCLRNQAHNMEWLVTHPFKTDSFLRCYHDDEHVDIKTLKLRNKNERPNAYYGMEIEVEFYRDCVDIDDDEAIDTILGKFTEITKGIFVYERDGSLENGVELISRPCSYDFLIKPSTVKMIKEGFEYLKNEGAMLKQPSTNGVHIHVSKRFFTAGERYLDYSLQNFDWLFQRFQPQLELLGRRNYTHYCASKKMSVEENLKGRTYSGSNVEVSFDAKVKLKKGGCPGYQNHNIAVNSTDDTVEVRTFNSTIDYKELYSYIEIVRNFIFISRDGDINKTLDEILHTKQNRYLDEHIQRTKMLAHKLKLPFDLEEQGTEEIEFVVSQLR